MKKIKTLTINLSNADGYAYTHEEIIKKNLKKKGLLSDNYLYTIIDGDKLDILNKYGTYRKGNAIYAFRIDELRQNSQDENDLYNFLAEYKNPAMVVYKKDNFQDDLHYRYFFKEPDKKKESLEAIIKFKI